MASAAKPRIRIRDATPADVPALVDIHFGAFAPDVMGGLLNPGGITEDSKQKFGATLLPSATPEPGKGEVILRVAEVLPQDSADDDKLGAGEVVAFGKWVLHRHPRTEEQWNVEEPILAEEELGEGTNAEVYNAFIRELHVKRRKLAKGDPVLVLNILCTTPKRQRLGAGWALLTWGTALADELGIPTQLEASPPGYPLYRKAGYQPVEAHDLEVVKRWGAARREGQIWGENSVAELGPLAEGCFRSVVMRRPAPSKRL